MDPKSPGRVAVEFRVGDERYPFVGASEIESCTFELEEMIPRGDGVYSEFFRVRDADTDRILAIAEETPQVEPTLLAEDDEEALFEFEVAGGCIAVSLAEHGAYPTLVQGEEGEGRVVADVPRAEARELVRQVVDENPDVHQVGQRDEPGPTVGKAPVHRMIHEVLSMQQRAIVLTAISEGFYEWPQRASLQDIADVLDMDVDTVDTRLHNCEQLLLAALFENGTLDDVEEPFHPFVETRTPATD